MAVPGSTADHNRLAEAAVRSRKVPADAQDFLAVARSHRGCRQASRFPAAPAAAVCNGRVP